MVIITNNDKTMFYNDKKGFVSDRKEATEFLSCDAREMKTEGEVPSDSKIFIVPFSEKVLEECMKQAAFDSVVDCPDCGNGMEPDAGRCGECGCRNPVSLFI